MAHEAVLVELLAMVRRDDHERIVESPTSFQLVEQVADVPVKLGDGGIVGCSQSTRELRSHTVGWGAAPLRRIGGKARLELWRRAIRVVRVVVVHEHERRPTTAIPSEPS